MGHVLSHVRLFTTHGLYPSRLLCPWDFPGKNTGVGGHFLLHEVFLTQESNPSLLCLLHCRWILYLLSLPFKIICIFATCMKTQPCVSLITNSCFSIIKITNEEDSMRKCSHAQDYLIIFVKYFLRK